MTDLLIPVGIPGCGKSTYGRQFFGVGGFVASTDDIRESMGDVNDQARNDEVFKIYHDQIDDFLSQGVRVYADATNLTLRARTTLVNLAYKRGAAAHLIIFADCGVAVRRNLNRDRTVPPDAMRRMLDNYEQFMLDLPQERGVYQTITEIRSFG